MERVTEPELMDDAEQARAYSEADFANPHQEVVKQFVARFPELDAGRVIDLACGPADVTGRLARALPSATFVGVDGADAMIALGRERLARDGLDDRVTLERRFLPDASLRGLGPFDAAVCTGALHHFHDPMVLWNAMRDVSAPGTCVLVQDLTRPASVDAAHALVTHYAGTEPDVLQRDYFHSLLAAFTLDEIREQLESIGFGHFAVDAVSDRHVVVSGRVT
ncbi:MAG TPA: class I SAM-dependent methyltransferase [Acidimicrobiia bacterium]|nr:class I SAM-dependent methyltransferase [Acidimicrobiia bacterium]